MKCITKQTTWTVVILNDFIFGHFSSWFRIRINKNILAIQFVRRQHKAMCIYPSANPPAFRFPNMQFLCAQMQHYTYINSCSIRLSNMLGLFFCRRIDKTRANIILYENTPERCEIYGTELNRPKKNHVLPFWKAYEYVLACLAATNTYWMRRICKWDVAAKRALHKVLTRKRSSMRAIYFLNSSFQWIVRKSCRRQREYCLPFHWIRRCVRWAQTRCAVHTRMLLSSYKHTHTPQ